jgi:hypothetical protein
MLTDVAATGDRNVIKKKADKILRPHNRNTAHCNVRKSDTSNNEGNWNHLRIIWKITKRNLMT